MTELFAQMKERGQVGDRSVRHLTEADRAAERAAERAADRQREREWRSTASNRSTGDDSMRARDREIERFNERKAERISERSRSGNDNAMGGEGGRQSNHTAVGIGGEGGRQAAQAAELESTQAVMRAVLQSEKDSLQRTREQIQRQVAGRQTTDTQPQRQPERQPQRQTERQTERQTDRQPQRQTERNVSETGSGQLDVLDRYFATMESMASKKSNEIRPIQTTTPVSVTVSPPVSGSASGDVSVSVSVTPTQLPRAVPVPAAAAASSVVPSVAPPATATPIATATATAASIPSVDVRAAESIAVTAINNIAPASAPTVPVVPVVTVVTDATPVSVVAAEGGVVKGEKASKRKAKKTKALLESDTPPVTPALPLKAEVTPVSEVVVEVVVKGESFIAAKEMEIPSNIPPSSPSTQIQTETQTLALDSTLLPPLKTGFTLPEGLVSLAHSIGHRRALELFRSSCGMPVDGSGAIPGSPGAFIRSESMASGVEGTGAGVGGGVDPVPVILNKQSRGQAEGAMRAGIMREILADPVWGTSHLVREKSDPIHCSD
jgi:hypothetical protein